MADIALGAVGVVPLIGVAFNTYRSIYSHLKAFRHYTKDLNRTTRKLDAYKASFKLECWILIESSLGSDRVQLLKASPDRHWNDPNINAEFERNLSASYQSCLSIVEDITGQLKDFQKELDEFNPLLKDRAEDETLSDAVRRLRKRVHVVVNRKKYEGLCKELKESNNDLTELRLKIERLQSSQCHQKCLLDARRHRGDWGAACKARRASSALYQGLQQTWSCQSSPHGHHTMRLFLDLPEPRKICPRTMRMSLAVVGRSVNEGRMVPTVFHLRVDSEDTQWTDQPPLPPPMSTQSVQAYDIEGERSLKRIKRIMSGESSEAPLTRSTSHAAQSSAPSTAISPTEQASRDLACILDLCGHFGEHCLCPAQQVPQYIGYLNVADHVRHNFYRDLPQSRLQNARDENVPLSMMLGNASLRDVNMAQRLKLARTVAVAALTYFESPWLKDLWRLGNLSLLFGQPQDVDTVLKTLHLEVDLLSRKHLAVPYDDPAAMDMALTPENSTQLSDDDLLRQGIYNKTLHSLGIALVGIETARDFDPSDPNDVVSARKYARDSIFGEKYQQVIEKCFGYNCDLGRQKSHRLVFEDIVGSLEDMVAATSSMKLGSED